jgi:hypothetical protein
MRRILVVDAILAILGLALFGFSGCSSSNNPDARTSATHHTGSKNSQVPAECSKNGVCACQDCPNKGAPNCCCVKCPESNSTNPGCCAESCCLKAGSSASSEFKKSGNNPPVTTDTIGK